ncbi:MAG: pyridoxamine 5'-phosphate oxidase [Xanthomonadaceae bacterium]|nr:pyridoxamine 5'-phosphate oxidase [Xanthomonadaceae bacterium]
MGTDLDKLFSKDPYALFQTWFKEAVNAKLPEPNAMVLSTISDSGRPNSRVVLLKGVTNNQFQFFTNLHSQKGHEIEKNPQACLLFFWPTLGHSLGRQVRIDGSVIKLSDEESDAYFATRARDSQLGAWASHQSEVLDSRDTLEKRFHQAKERFEGQAVTRPPHWGGLALIPERFEFWIGQDNRLHDRCRYTLNLGVWARQRLNP